ncbi:PAS domain-containing protein, partial [Patescibacteria group bacterium]|nr:PAS domain-containing protein [Patescibacteria group bacterium]
MKNKTEHTGNWYQAMVENMQNGVWVSDKNVKVVYANPKLCSLLGYSFDEIVGKSEYAFWSKSSAIKVRQAIAVDRKKGRSSSYEAQLITKLGEKIPVLALGTPLPDGGSVGIITDLRELKKKEEARLELEKRYRTTFENTGAAMVIIEADTKISLVNSEFEKMSGMKSEEIENKKRFIDFFTKEDVDRMLYYHKTRREKKGKAPRNYEAQFIDKNGNIRYIYLTVAMIPGTTKSIASLLDISKRKEAQKALKESEEKYRSMIDQSMVGICMLKDTKVVFANKKLANIFGYSLPKDLMGKDISKFLSKESFDLARDYTIRRQRGEKLPELGEYIGKKKNKKQIHIQTFSKVIELKEKTYSQVFVTDVTEKKIMEIKLAERIKEVDVLYRVYSHTKMIHPLAQVLSSIAKDIIHAFQF